MKRKNFILFIMIILLISLPNAKSINVTIHDTTEIPEAYLKIKEKEDGDNYLANVTLFFLSLHSVEWTIRGEIFKNADFNDNPNCVKDFIDSGSTNYSKIWNLNRTRDYNGYILNVAELYNNISLVKGRTYGAALMIVDNRGVVWRTLGYKVQIGSFIVTYYYNSSDWLHVTGVASDEGVVGAYGNLYDSNSGTNVHGGGFGKEGVEYELEDLYQEPFEIYNLTTIANVTMKMCYNVAGISYVGHAWNTSASGSEAWYSIDNAMCPKADEGLTYYYRTNGYGFILPNWIGWNDTTLLFYFGISNVVNYQEFLFKLDMNSTLNTYVPDIILTTEADSSSGNWELNQIFGWLDLAWFGAWLRILVLYINANLIETGLLSAAIALAGVVIKKFQDRKLRKREINKSWITQLNNTTDKYSQAYKKYKRALNK